MINKSALNVGIVIDGLGGGGAEKQAIITTHELLRLGVHVRLVCYTEINEYPELLAKYNISPVAIAFKCDSRLKKIFKLTKYFRENKFDVVYAFKGNSSMFAMISAYLARTPNIYCGYRSQGKPRFFFRLLNRLLSVKSSGWIVNADCVKKKVIQYFKVKPEKIFVVPNGIYYQEYNGDLSKEQARKKFGFNINNDVVTIIANLTPVKNHTMLLKVAKKVLDKRKDVTFVLAGEGKERAFIENEIKKSNLKDHIILLGRCNEIPNLLKSTDIAVLTSYTEGLPNSILEAASTGLPCISTACGDVTRVVLHNKSGYIVDSNDDDTMAKYVLQLLDDDALCDKMGSLAARHIKENYSPEKLAKLLIHIFSDSIQSMKEHSTR